MTSSTKTFSDVADGKWYSSYIRQAVQYGLISGYTDGTFRPEQYITRAETVTMINRMLGRNYGNGRRTAQHGLSVPLMSARAAGRMAISWKQLSRTSTDRKN